MPGQSISVWNPDLFGDRPLDDTLLFNHLGPRSFPQDAPPPPNAPNWGGINIGGVVDNSNTSQSLAVSNVTNNTNAVLPGKFTRKAYRVIKVDLTVAAVNLQVNVSGTLFWCVWGATWTGAGIGAPGGQLISGPAYETGNGVNVRGAGDATLTATVRFDFSNNDEIPFGPGIELSGNPFQRFFLSFAAQPGKVLEIYIATDVPLDRLDAAN